MLRYIALHRRGVIITMKSKIKFLILALVIVGLSVAYSFVDKTVSIYDTKVDTSDFQSISMEIGKELSQTFICTENNLDGISLKISADNVSDNTQVLIGYSLIDNDSKEIVSEGRVTLEELQSGSFFKIRFDRISECAEKEYVLTMSLLECPSGNIRLFYTPGNAGSMELDYDGEHIGGVEVMRTLTHRFDVETFVVTICFAVYIILFMRWLYKLFE